MTEQATMSNATVRVVREDITLFDTDAFVFYAQPDLALGTGFGNAIAVRGGPKVQKELNELAPVEPCGVVASGAGKLPATYILHAVGPRFLEPDFEEKLTKTIANVMKLADEKGIKRLALPPMARGFYGLPLPKSAELTVGSIKDYLTGETGIEEVVICVNDRIEVKAFEDRL
jgi:O-acetyl-ADP-ribose deacetylase